MSCCLCLNHLRYVCTTSAGIHSNSADLALRVAQCHDGPSCSVLSQDHHHPCFAGKLSKIHSPLECTPKFLFNCCLTDRIYLPSTRASAPGIQYTIADWGKSYRCALAWWALGNYFDSIYNKVYEILPNFRRSLWNLPGGCALIEAHCLLTARCKS